MGFTISGLSAVTETLQQMADEVEAVRGLEKVAQRVKAESQKNAPVRFGTLRDSARVQQVSSTTWRVAFTVRYALAVHEKTEVDYQNGESKYLERALDKIVSSGEAAELIRDSLQKFAPTE